MPEVRKGVFPAMLRETYADDSTQPFWDAALEDRLVGSRCTNCGTVLLPPQPYCFVCQHRDFEWVELPGTGTIYSFTVVRHPLAPHLSEVVPYVSGVIDLDGTQGAGARMIANVIDCDPETVRIGDRVEVVFEKITDTYAMPRFRPRETSD